MIILLCGLSGAGKTTLANSVKNSLTGAAILTEIIDADEYRQKLFTDLKYSKADRFENVRRLGFIADKFSTHDIVTIISAIMPYDDMRRELMETYDGVKLVHIDCPLQTLMDRDTKGLYRRALLPDGHPQRLCNLSGVNDPFQPPHSPDVYINTQTTGIAECTAQLSAYIQYHHQLSRKRSVAC